MGEWVWVCVGVWMGCYVWVAMKYMYAWANAHLIVYM